MTSRQIAQKAIRDLQLQNYWDSLPFELYRAALSRVGFRMIDEDGSDLSCIFCGDEGSCWVQLAINAKAQKFGLRFQWWTTPRGRKEINAYVS